MNTLGTRINEIRKSNHVTQAKFGQMLGISQTHVSKLEKDIEHPSETLLLFISHIFNVDINWLKTGEGTSIPTQGSSIEGTLNRYHWAKFEFEKWLESLNTDELWGYVESYFYSTNAIQLFCDGKTVTDDEVIINYLRNMENVFQFLWLIFVTTKELLDKQKKMHNGIKYDDLEHYQLKCNKFINELEAKVKVAVNSLLHQADINITI